MTRQTCTALVAAVLGLIILPAATVGQESGGQEQPDTHTRSGFWFNGGLGWGSLGCESCTDREGGGVVSLGVGGTVNQKVMLGASIDGWSREENGSRLTASSLLATIRFYPSSSGGFFLRGGLGLGVIEAELSGLGAESESGGAALLGLGYDFRVSDDVSLTPFLNGVGVSTDNSDVNFNQLGLSVTVH